MVDARLKTLPTPSTHPLHFVIVVKKNKKTREMEWGSTHFLILSSSKLISSIVDRLPHLIFVNQPARGGMGSDWGGAMLGGMAGRRGRSGGGGGVLGMCG